MPKARASVESQYVGNHHVDIITRRPLDTFTPTPVTEAPCASLVRVPASPGARETVGYQQGCDTDQAIGIIDTTTGTPTAMATFAMYERIGPHVRMPQPPNLIFDTSGFWYFEQLPTLSGTPGTDATSDGPTHLFHVAAPVNSTG